jgi:hypothetical protein
MCPQKAVFCMCRSYRHFAKLRHIEGFTNVSAFFQRYAKLQPVSWIRIRMIWGLLDPDPLVRVTDPDPSIINKKFTGTFNTTVNR